MAGIAHFSNLNQRLTDLKLRSDGELHHGNLI
jgi:hypothetical protein